MFKSVDLLTKYFTAYQTLMRVYLIQKNNTQNDRRDLTPRILTLLQRAGKHVIEEIENVMKICRIQLKSGPVLSMVFV